MKFGFMPERETIHAVFIVRKLQEEYHAKGKMYEFCGPRKALNRVPRKKLEWAMRKKGISEVLVGSVMSQYE